MFLVLKSPLLFSHQNEQLFSKETYLLVLLESDPLVSNVRDHLISYAPLPHDPLCFNENFYIERDQFDNECYPQFSSENDLLFSPMTDH